MIMLSQDDRRRLESIERDLEYDDRAFVARMRRASWLRRRLLLVSAVVVLELAAVVVIAATAGRFAAFGAVPILASAIPLVRHLRRYRRWSKSDRSR